MGSLPQELDVIFNEHKILVLSTPPLVVNRKEPGTEVVYMTIFPPAYTAHLQNDWDTNRQDGDTLLQYMPDGRAVLFRSTKITRIEQYDDFAHKLANDLTEMFGVSVGIQELDGMVRMAEVYWGVY